MSFGLALAMALTPARLVTSGYYRNNLYVLLGMNVLASLIAWNLGLPLWPPVVAAILSYVGAVCWLYEKPRPGTISLVLIAIVTLVGAWTAEPVAASDSLSQQILTWLDPVGGGLVLGVTMAAMLLGHWYLNAPGMKLAPLERLVLLMAVAIALRAAESGCGLALEIVTQPSISFTHQWMIALRWLAGLGGAAIVTVLAWQTLKIPNTQSATGILYVGVIVTFLGELTAQLLSGESAFPL
jgi:hypothetical protein